MPVQPPAAATDLSITVTASPGAKPLDYRLVVENGRPGPETTVPDPAAAVAALERYGQAIFFPVPGPPRMCSDVYSGPQVAVVRGVFKGRDVRSTFKRTDSCETARWQALAPLFGAVAGGTGAT
ncbi:serine protease inhibitor [Arthrobacter sp. STN4]|nr:serine protease inhibitor [Arthrobacter sp. SDTb3-6]MCQ9164637.1 serine protease inhibitor [Arthrobacter sp. STN4]NVM97206.1 serine protease inhibitor [Arthrobacter sp. SDTb3-6]